MVSPGDEYSPAHSNGQTTSKDPRDRVLLSPTPVERKGVINPSSDGAEAASSILVWQGQDRSCRCSSSAVLSEAAASKQNTRLQKLDLDTLSSLVWFPFFYPPHNTTSLLGYSGRILLHLSALLQQVKWRWQTHLDFQLSYWET